MHLKDVLAVGEPHETCRWGEGIVDIEACVRALSAIGYGGAYTVEHEPETLRPERGSAARCESSSKGGSREGRDRRLRQHRARAMRRGSCAVDGLELVGATDVDPRAAERLSPQFGGRAYAILDALLADDRVELSST